MLPLTNWEVRYALDSGEYDWYISSSQTASLVESLTAVDDEILYLGLRYEHTWTAVVCEESQSATVASCFGLPSSDRIGVGLVPKPQLPGLDPPAVSNYFVYTIRVEYRAQADLEILAMENEILRAVSLHLEEDNLENLSRVMSLCKADLSQCQQDLGKDPFLTCQPANSWC
ncbi:hypothetical protein BASA81_011157 [Batrachochytrium salamandrivorans]|nr:hypothetical protein BASA81_011157 [Batrachochytrium salamandrivorans]